ncbi:hypothetical protein CVU37_08930 [candidate division BRC1 bacterium HGW-BRC1-1]|jgi:hypothetical protein|nr:MAG: hypothetical protein CVU37_08930 [candidate division BRC1 bacterium HGW-BRC1-1]
MPTDPASLILLLGAAFVAGALNAVAGGGSFLTLPALIFTGVPPVVANATGTVALLPGYISAALGFRVDMKAPPGMNLRSLAVLSILGGGTGAALLLMTGDVAFGRIVPWLMAASTIMFAMGPWLTRRRGSGGEGAGYSPKSVLGTMAVTAYGGYFNGGLGIMLLAWFGLLGQTNLNAMNGLKNLVSALLTAMAVLVYAAGGVVWWPHSLLMMVAATAGGYWGARIARRIPPHILRGGIVAVGTVMTALFFMRN